MKVGIIAGGGQFPVLFSKKAKKKGYQVFAVAFKNEASDELTEYVDQIAWLHLGQVSRLVRFFRTHRVSQAVMLGTITKTSLFRDIKPDFTALKLLARNRQTHDDHILKQCAGYLETQGIEIRASTFLLPELICEKGVWTKKKPGAAVMEDIYHGWRITKEIGKLDIGQCIVMGNGSVLAVEGPEGTDETIKRGGRLSRGKGALVIKLSKPFQDLRFDMPTAGLQTVMTMKEYGADVLVLEAGKTICFDKDEMIGFADSHHISIIVMDQEDIP